MSQRRPFRSSRQKVIRAFGGFGKEMLPSQIQKLTHLSRPTVFNVLKYYTEKGCLDHRGKKYSLSRSFFKVRSRRKEPLKGIWLMRYEHLLENCAEKNGITIQELPLWFKEFVEARIRNEKHFANFYGLSRSMMELPGWESEIRSAPFNEPFDPDLNSWNRNQAKILKQLKGKRH
jgi:hypothetical protein